MQRILSLSLLFVAVVFTLWSSSGVEGLPTESKQSSGATPTGNDKIDNSHATKKKGEPNHHHTTKKSDSHGEASEVKDVHSETTIEPTKTRHHGRKHKEHKSLKTLLEKQIKNLTLLSDLNFTSEIVKRNSPVKVLEKEQEISNVAKTKEYDKPLDIEVKSYTPPPNVSAIIEVMAHKPDKTVAENSWLEYQPYPYFQDVGQYISYLSRNPQFLQSGYPLVPTEELLHGQSFSNNPSVSQQVLYQYPLLRSLGSNPVNSLGSEPNSVHGTAFFFNNNPFPPNVTPKPKEDSDSLSSANEQHLKNEPVNKQDQDTQSITVIQQPQYTGENPVVVQPEYHFVIPQNNAPSVSLPDLNYIQNSASIDSEPNLTYKPKLSKYVTRSFILKTHPKLEWVPL